MKEWQKATSWPRRVSIVPAEDGTGYRYNPVLRGNGIIRTAAPARRATWEKSPQVRGWMDDPDPGILRRFREWLDK